MPPHLRKRPRPRPPPPPLLDLSAVTSVVPAARLAATLRRLRRGNSVQLLVSSLHPSAAAAPPPLPALSNPARHRFSTPAVAATPRTYVDCEQSEARVLLREVVVQVETVDAAATLQLDVPATGPRAARVAGSKTEARGEFVFEGAGLALFVFAAVVLAVVAWACATGGAMGRVAGWLARLGVVR